MIKMLGNDIYRNDEKIGWIEGNHIYAHDGKKIGYFDSQHIYGPDGDKVAYLDSQDLYDAAGNRKAHLEDVAAEIEGILPNSAKCAIYALFGT